MTDMLIAGMNNTTSFEGAASANLNPTGGGTITSGEGAVPLTPEAYAASWKMALRLTDMGRDRTKQTAAGILGVSDVFGCHEKVRRTLTNEPPSNVVTSSSAIIGTAIHEATLNARLAVFPHLLIEQTVEVALPNGMVVRGHADEIDPTEPSVSDLKTVNGLDYVRRNGSTDSQRSQRHLYYAGAAQAGIVPQAGTTRNIWLDRSGQTDEFHVEQEPYDPTWLDAAALWLDDVTYAIEHDEPASKDKEIPFCLAYCAFSADCRKSVYQVVELTDPDVILAARTHLDAAREEKVAGKVKDQAKELLKGVEGSAGGLKVRWITVNGKVPYQRLEVRESV